MFEVTYDPNHGTAMPDGEVETYYDEYVTWWCRDSEPDYHYQATFSTSLIFDRIRVGIAEGDIPANSVVFIFNDEKIPINEDGMITSWPEGFLDQNIKYLMRIIP